MKYIVIVLAIATVLHDISIFRLDRKVEVMRVFFTECVQRLKEFEKYANEQTEPMKTTDYCDICKRDMCEDCIADANDPYCVPSHYEMKQTEPQIDCYMCKWLGEVNICGRCRNRNLFAEANIKPQTIDLGNGFSITANDCDTCKYDISEDDYDLYDMCEPMVEGECKYEPKDEPQAEREGE